MNLDVGIWDFVPASQWAHRVLTDVTLLAL